jgi:sterol desaturase/sphingolipid hydroxylase (fatty acid hydroxylase superfamily)
MRWVLIRTHRSQNLVLRPNVGCDMTNQDRQWFVTTEEVVIFWKTTRSRSWLVTTKYPFFAMSGVGFSPRVFPRPTYPPLSETIVQMVRSVGFQSGVLGTLICLLIYPSYLQLMLWFKNVLGDNYNDAMLVTILLSISHTGTFVVINGLFGLFDYFSFFQEFKLARKPYMIPKLSLVARCLIEALIGQLVISPLGAYYLLYPAFINHGMVDSFSPLPSPFELFRGFCLANLFNGITFYCSHRLFHSKLLYATFHKQHHEFNGTIGIAAEYANPIEQIFANMIPTLAGMILYPTHPLCVAVWLVSFAFLFLYSSSCSLFVFDKPMKHIVATHSKILSLINYGSLMPMKRSIMTIITQ